MFHSIWLCIYWSTEGIIYEERFGVDEAVNDQNVKAFPGGAWSMNIEYCLKTIWSHITHSGWILYGREIVMHAQIAMLLIIWWCYL